MSYTRSDFPSLTGFELAKRCTKQTKRSQTMQKTRKMVRCWWDIRAGNTNDVNCVVLQKRSLALLEAISDESIHRFANSEPPNMKAFRWFSRKHETRFCTAGRSRKRTKNNDFSRFLVFCVFVLFLRKTDLPDELKLCSTVTFLCTQVGSTV